MEENTNYNSTELTEKECCIYGWDDDMDVARSIWGSIHNSLLEGDLLFAYRPRQKKNARLLQIIIVRNFHIDRSGMIDRKVYDDFAVGYITSGYTALLPHVPLRYLKEEMAGFLDEWGIDKKVLNTYKAIIEDLENETISD